MRWTKVKRLLWVAPCSELIPTQLLAGAAGVLFFSHCQSLGSFLIFDLALIGGFWPWSEFALSCTCLSFALCFPCILRAFLHIQQIC